ncbi:MAG: hypothetical protein ACLPN1_13140 [Dissulfurispiraceae bacterium]
MWSTPGLTLGSYLNFELARICGRPFVEKFIEKSIISRFDYLLYHKGAFLVFLLFLIPRTPRIISVIFSLLPSHYNGVSHHWRGREALRDYTAYCWERIYMASAVPRVLSSGGNSHYRYSCLACFSKGNSRGRSE